MSATPASVNQTQSAESLKQSRAYVETGATRDLRIDLMRGFVVPLLIIGHFDYFSVFAYIGWERIGIVSAAEIFVMLSGIVIGLVYGKKLKQQGMSSCFWELLKRGSQLYRINLFIILSVGLLRYLPGLDSTVITNFHDPYANADYPLYPPVETGFFNLLSTALLLQCGPHQFQIIGLYVVLFLFFTPLTFWMLEKQQLKLLLGISWGLYFINYGTLETEATTPEIRWTGAQYEYAFPTIAWQLIFVNCIVIGYYKQALLDFFQNWRGKLVIYLAFLCSVLLLLFAWNNPIEAFADWSKLTFISPETFHSLYDHYFQKYNLGPGRLLNLFSLLLSIYVLLTRYWQPINQVVGWFLIPLGQASLYVFFVHIFLLLLVSNTPFPAMQNFWVHSTIHMVVLIIIWVMVKKAFLFRWIPR